MSKKMQMIKSKCDNKNKWYFIKQSDFVKALFLNVVILILLMILFTPTIKSDDYYMSEISYGAASGNYDVHLIYSNILLGYLIKGLLLLVPQVPWYVMLQIIAVFCAFVTITWYLLKYYSNKSILVLSFIFLLWFGYECYIRITFTKTSFILITCGVFLLFKEIASNKKQWKLCVIGLLEVFIGLLYRRANLSSVLGMMIGVCFIEIFSWYLKKENIKFIAKKGILYLCSLCLMLGVSSALAQINQYMYSLTPGWDDYYYLNNLKSMVVDYTSNNYGSNADKYQAIGISNNDLEMIYNNDLYDFDFITEEKIRDIVSIAQTEKQSGGWKELFNIRNIAEFLRTVPIEYLKRTSFCCFIILSLFLILNRSKKTMVSLFYALILMLAENYYLFLKGRVLQPYIDAGIIFSACLFLLYFMEEKSEKQLYSKKMNLNILSVSVLAVFMLLSSFDSLVATFFWDYGSQEACNPEQGREIMDVICKDSSNLYITSSKENVFSRWAFHTFEIIPKGYYRNVFYMGSYIWPSHKQILQKYNVENPLREIADAENMYFLISDNLEGAGVNIFQTYIQEHFDKNTVMEKVKEINTANIYRCTSEDLKIKKYPIGNREINQNLNYIIKNGQIIVKGYCFAKNSNSYNQNSYVEIIDSQTNKKYYYSTLQKENPYYHELMNGKYSLLESRIDRPEYWDKHDKINLVLIDKETMYRIPVKK